MTERKPASLTVPQWVERQIRQADAAGAFDALPGAGKPIPGIDDPRHELAWVADYLRREDVDSSALLAPALALAKEVEDLPQRLVRERDAARARALVVALNRRIDAAYAAPQVGPPLRVKLIDVEAALADRQRARAALDLARRLEREASSRGDVPADPAPTDGAAPRRRRWSRRR